MDSTKLSQMGVRGGGLEKNASSKNMQKVSSSVRTPPAGPLEILVTPAFLDYFFHPLNVKSVKQ